MDLDISKSFMDSLQERGVWDFIIYQTTQTTDKETEHNMVTYILWNEKENTKILLITNNCVLLDSAAMTSNNIFLYPDLNKLWLRKDEDIYKIVPNYAEPYDKDIVIYITSKHKRFFEVGRNVFYQLNYTRNKCRNEFIILLKKLLIQFNGKGKKIANYHRE
jgi:hypothetical protein